MPKIGAVFVVIRIEESDQRSKKQKDRVYDSQIVVCKSIVPTSPEGKDFLHMVGVRGILKDGKITTMHLEGLPFNGDIGMRRSNIEQIHFGTIEIEAAKPAPEPTPAIPEPALSRTNARVIPRVIKSSKQIAAEKRAKNLKANLKAKAAQAKAAQATDRVASKPEISSTACEPELTPPDALNLDGVATTATDTASPALIDLLG